MPSHRYDSTTRLIEQRHAACGSTMVIAVDGPSGSGKTGFVEGLAEATGAAVLHLEDIYPGWHGLSMTPLRVADVLDSVAVGEIGTVRRWDWAGDRPGSPLHVGPVPLLILDGVGSGAAIIRPHLSLLIWVEAPTAVRKERALARDGGAYEPFWDIWAAQEASHFVAEGTRRRADLIIDTR